MVGNTPLVSLDHLVWLCPLPGSCPPPAPWWGRNVGEIVLVLCQCRSEVQLSQTYYNFHPFHTICVTLRFYIIDVSSNCSIVFISHYWDLLTHRFNLTTFLSHLLYQTYISLTTILSFHRHILLSHSMGFLHPSRSVTWATLHQNGWSGQESSIPDCWHQHWSSLAHHIISLAPCKIHSSSVHVVAVTLLSAAYNLHHSFFFPQC